MIPALRTTEESGLMVGESAPIVLVLRTGVIPYFFKPAETTDAPSCEGTASFAPRHWPSCRANDRTVRATRDESAADRGQYAS